MIVASRRAFMHALKGARSCELEPVMGAAGPRLRAGHCVAQDLLR
jgi:hypothetical protein